MYDMSEKSWLVGMYIPYIDAWYIFPDYLYHYSFNGIYNYLKYPYNEIGRERILSALSIFFTHHQYTEADIDFLKMHEEHNFYSGFETLTEYEKYEVSTL